MKLGDSFGPWLKARRKALDLTQRELAEQVGCPLWTADERLVHAVQGGFAQLHGLGKSSKPVP